MNSIKFTKKKPKMYTQKEIILLSISENIDILRIRNNINMKIYYKFLITTIIKFLKVNFQSTFKNC